MNNRPTSVRAEEALARLQSESNVWVATASSDGVPHLVPLSLAWIDGHVVVATPSDTPTAQNGVATGRARAALDSADDVAIFDVDVEVVDFDDAEEALKNSYVDRVGWDPSEQPRQLVPADLDATPRPGMERSERDLRKDHHPRRAVAERRLTTAKRTAEAENPVTGRCGADDIASPFSVRAPGYSVAGSDNRLVVTLGGERS